MGFRVGWVDDPELSVRVLVLHDVGLAETLELHRGCQGVAGDKRSEEDTYCLVCNSAAVVYGGVETFELDGTRLTLTLTPEAAGILGVPRVVSYDLEVEGVVLAEQRLPEILA